MKLVPGFMLAITATVSLAAPPASEAPRVVQLAVSDPAAVKSFDQVVPGGAHVTAYSFKAKGAGAIGLSELEGPLHPTQPVGSAELFVVYDGSATITQANGPDLPVKKGDIVFVPRGVAYGGKDFVHYKHAYIVFDKGNVPVAGFPSALTLVRPEALVAPSRGSGIKPKHRDFYRGADGSIIRLQESNATADRNEQRVLQWSEFSVVLHGSVEVKDAGGSWTAQAGDMFFAPRGAAVSYASHDLSRLVVITDRRH